MVPPYPHVPYFSRSRATRRERSPELQLLAFHALALHPTAPEVLERAAATPDVDGVGYPDLGGDGTSHHPDGKAKGKTRTSALGVFCLSLSHDEKEGKTYTSRTAPSHEDFWSLTPTCSGPNLTYWRNTCAMIDPNLPAAADIPWQVQRYFVGKTSAEICRNGEKTHNSRGAGLLTA
jgi:hypothetical protein